MNAEKIIYIRLKKFGVEWSLKPSVEHLNKMKT